MHIQPRNGHWPRRTTCIHLRRNARGGSQGEAVEERGGDVESWDIIFDVNEISKYEDCGVAFLDAPSEIVEIALNYLGHDPNTENTKANQEALDLLNQIRPYIKYFDSSQYIDDLANGEICLAIGWSGDVFIAAYEEIEEVWYKIMEDVVTTDGQAPYWATHDDVREW